MIRKIIKIDDEKCIGCGDCASACHEGAIGMVDGKAKLLREDYCDGLGDCLPACPVDAISFEEREAPAYDEAAVLKAKAQKPLPCGCPGTQSRKVSHEHVEDCSVSTADIKSRLSQWPVQIKLVPVNAAYFNNADLLIAADCTAYAFGDFHNQFIKNRITIIGCPKLDEEDYSDKLTKIISQNNIRSITIVRMEVPCCGGIQYAAEKALEKSGKSLSLNVVTISVDGKILR